MSSKKTIDPVTKEEAESLGLEFYYTGDPCLFKHISKRYVDTDECWLCAYNKKRNLPPTTAVGDQILRHATELSASLVGTKTLPYQPEYKHLTNTQIRTIARAKGAVYFEAASPCKRCNTNKKIVSSSACYECRKAYLRNKKQGIITEGSSPRLPISTATAVVAAMAFNYAGATTKTISTTVIKIYPKATNSGVRQKITRIKNNGLIETNINVGRHALWQIKDEFFRYYRHEIDTLAGMFDDVRSQNVVREAFDAVLNPKQPDPELACPEEEVIETAMQKVASAVESAEAPSESNNGNDIETLPAALVGECIFELIKTLKEQNQDDDLLRQIRTKDELIDKLKVKYNKLAAQYNWLEESAAAQKRLLKEKIDELTRVRAQHNEIIEGIAAKSNGRVTLKDVAKISGALGLSEFRDQLPEGE